MLRKNAGIRIVHGAPYKPSTQGSIESANKTYKLRLRALQTAHGTRNWVQFLPDIAIAINNTRNRSLPLNVTPYEAHFNRRPHYYYGTAADCDDTLTTVENVSSEHAEAENEAEAESKEVVDSIEDRRHLSESEASGGADSGSEEVGTSDRNERTRERDWSEGDGSDEETLDNDGSSEDEAEGTESERDDESKHGKYIFPPSYWLYGFNSSKTSFEFTPSGVSCTGNKTHS